MNILHIDASPQGNTASVSRQLSAATVAHLQTKYSHSNVVYRDLAINAPGHLSATELAAFWSAPDQWTPEMASAMAINTAILNEFQAADVIVIGVPMYNFGAPSSVKAWIDRLARAGITFRYTAQGPEGLVKGKSVILLSSRGGVYEGTTWGAGLDHQEKHLKDFFGFLGISDCTCIRAEGTSSDPVKTINLNKALDQIAAL